MKLSVGPPAKQVAGPARGDGVNSPRSLIFLRRGRARWGGNGGGGAAALSRQPQPLITFGLAGYRVWLLFTTFHSISPASAASSSLRPLHGDTCAGRHLTCLAGRRVTKLDVEYFAADLGSETRRSDITCDRIYDIAYSVRWNIPRHSFSFTSCAASTTPSASRRKRVRSVSARSARRRHGRQRAAIESRSPIPCAHLDAYRSGFRSKHCVSSRSADAVTTPSGSHRAQRMPNPISPSALCVSADRQGEGEATAFRQVYGNIARPEVTRRRM